MKNHITALFYISTLIFFSSCGYSDNRTFDKWCFTEKAQQKLFMSALEESKIKHSFSVNDGCFSIDSKHQEKVRKLHGAILGEPPPAGLNISRGKNAISP